MFFWHESTPSMVPQCGSKPSKMLTDYVIYNLLIFHFILLQYAVHRQQVTNGLARLLLKLKKALLNKLLFNYLIYNYFSIF